MHVYLHASGSPNSRSLWKGFASQKRLGTAGLEHTSLSSKETGVPVSVSSVQRAAELLKLHIRIVNIHTFTQ